MDTTDFASRYGAWALITGASEGTGAAFARELAGRGLKLILIARREEPLRALAEEIGASGGECVTAAVDLAQPGAAERVIAAAGDREVGLFIANAGADTVGAELPRRRRRRLGGAGQPQHRDDDALLPCLRRPDAGARARRHHPRRLGRLLRRAAGHRCLLRIEGLRPRLCRGRCGPSFAITASTCSTWCSAAPTRRRTAARLRRAASRSPRAWPRPRMSRGSALPGCRTARSATGARKTTRPGWRRPRPPTGARGSS